MSATQKTKSFLIMVQINDLLLGDQGDLFYIIINGKKLEPLFLKLNLLIIFLITKVNIFKSLLIFNLLILIFYIQRNYKMYE